MKKTLLAAALLAGFAGAAQAETSVTLYGIIDLGVGYQQIKGHGFDSKSKIGLTNGVQNGSRWGLRGSEDLGDGLKAVFDLESGFNSADGSSAQGSRLFGRQSTVGLASDSWGQLDFGRQTNIASKFFGSIDPFAEGFNQANIGTAFSSANTTRYDNMILYQTPIFSGFQAGVGYSFNVDDTNTSETSWQTGNNQRNINGGIRYVNGPINVAAAYDQLNRSNAATDVGTGDSIKAWLVGGTYDFEVVKLALAFGQTKGGWIQASSTSSSVFSGPVFSAPAGGQYGTLATNVYRDGFRANSYLLGLSAPIGGATSLFGSWQRMDPSNDNFYPTGAAAGSDATSNVYSLGVTYDLSKRTNLYGLASYATDYAFVDGLKSTLVSVGIRHRF